MSENDSAEGSARAVRHVTWLELFFDLVVVVAVAQLAHLLHGDEHPGPNGWNIAAFFTLYLAIWLLWTSFTLYGNVAGEKTRQNAMFIGMAGIAVMAASVPDATGDRADLFAAAYLVTSVVSARVFMSTGKLVLDWSVAQQNAGGLPWIVSFFVDNPHWKLWLWVCGLALSLYSTVVRGFQKNDAKELERMNKTIRQRNQQQLIRQQQVLSRHGRPQRAPEMQTFEVAELHEAHLGERLGLFVIIVLGEAMLQLVGAVSEGVWKTGDDWNQPLILAAASGFVLLICLWWLNFRHGFADETSKLRRSVPHVLVLPAHFVAIAGVTTLAVGLGAAATYPTAHLPGVTRWLMCAGLSAFLLVIALLSLPARNWPIGFIAVAVPLVLAGIGFLLPAYVLVIGLAVIAWGQVLMIHAITPNSSQPAVGAN